VMCLKMGWKPESGNFTKENTRYVKFKQTRVQEFRSNSNDDACRALSYSDDS